jgi:DNA-binding PadR family transcriptional regulator
MFRYLVLGLLRRGEPHHGYAMMKAYRERAGVQISTGNFYRELQRLMADGLVRTASNPPGTDPRRAPYEITEAGAAAFDAWMAEPLGAGIGNHEDGLSARAVFLSEGNVDAAARALERWQEELWLRGKTLERAREIVLRQQASDPEHRSEVLALLLARRLKHVAADLEFIEEFRAACNKWVYTPGEPSTVSAQQRALRRRAPGTRIPGGR